MPTLRGRGWSSPGVRCSGLSGAVPSGESRHVGLYLGPGESRTVSARVDAAQWTSKIAESSPRAGVRLVASLHARNLHPRPSSDSRARSLLANRIIQFADIAN